MKFAKILLLSALFVCLALDAQAKDEEVSIPLEWGTLKGSMMTPETGSETAVLFIAGSGPTDRDGNSQIGIKAAPYYLLAKFLEEKGIASLRYDKRGLSKIEDKKLAKESNMRFDHFIDDAKSCIAYLRDAGYKKIVLAGHSEGALIALVAAQENPDVTAVISIAGAGYPIGEVLKLQLACQLAAVDPALMMKCSNIIDNLAQGKPVNNVPQDLQVIFSSSVQPYLISWMKYDPRTLIKTLTIPVLIINGDNDIQVTADNAQELYKAQPKAKKVIIPKMTHVLKDSDARDAEGQMNVYMNGNLPLNERVGTEIVNFINSL